MDSSDALVATMPVVRALERFGVDYYLNQLGRKPSQLLAIRLVQVQLNLQRGRPERASETHALAILVLDALERSTIGP